MHGSSTYRRVFSLYQISSAKVLMKSSVYQDGFLEITYNYYSYTSRYLLRGLCRSVSNLMKSESNSRIPEHWIDRGDVTGSEGLGKISLIHQKGFETNFIYV